MIKRAGFVVLLAAAIVAPLGVRAQGSGGGGAFSSADDVLRGSGSSSGSGSGSGSGSASGSGSGSGSGSASGSGPTAGSGSASGSGPTAGSGSAGSGSAGSGSAGSGSAGSGSAGSGSAGSGSAGSGSAGSGSGTGPRIIQLPSDISAPEVDASASPTAIRLGGRFTLFVSAICDPGVEANLREPFELGPSFEIKRKDSKDTPRADGKKIREWQVEVLAWDLGDLVIPGITVTYTVQGKVGQVQTNAVRLRVDGVLGDVVDDPKALRGAHPPTALISRDWFWLWVGAAIGALLGALGGYVWLRSLKRRKRTVKLTGGIMAIPRKKIDMTAEKALAALQKIKDSGVLDREADRKRGYTEMVDVIRDYIGARYHVASRDLTSLELIRNLKTVAPDEERAMVESWLERCDRVKYGAYRTSSGQANTVLDDARGLIVATTQLRDAAASTTTKAEAA